MKFSLTILLPTASLFKHQSLRWYSDRVDFPSNVKYKNQTVFPRPPNIHTFSLKYAGSFTTADEFHLSNQASPVYRHQTAPYLLYHYDMIPVMNTSMMRHRASWGLFCLWKSVRPINFTGCKVEN